MAQGLIRLDMGSKLASIRKIGWCECTIVQYMYIGSDKIQEQGENRVYYVITVRHIAARRNLIQHKASGQRVHELRYYNVLF
jgi:hypothetical protein